MTNTSSPIVNQLNIIANELDEAIADVVVTDNQKQYRLLMAAQAAVATLQLLAAQMDTK